MEIIFKEGFRYKGFSFGWKGTQLYRLPTKKRGRNYTLRKVPKIAITEKISGYRICRDKKSVAQVNEMTKKIKPFAYSSRHAKAA